MSFSKTRELRQFSLIGMGAREAETASGVIDREDFDGATSLLLGVVAGSGATTISASRIHVFQSETVSATASGGTAIASGTTSGLTFTASGIIGLDMDLRTRARFIGVTLSTPNVATSGINGVIATMSDGTTGPPAAALDGFVNIRRIGQSA